MERKNNNEALNNELSQLEEAIEEKRRELNRLIKIKEDNLDKDILELSIELDHNIAKYLKLRKKLK